FDETALPLAQKLAGLAARELVDAGDRRADKRGLFEHKPRRIAELAVLVILDAFPHLRFQIFQAIVHPLLPSLDGVDWMALDQLVVKRPLRLPVAGDSRADDVRSGAERGAGFRIAADRPGNLL